MRGLILRTYRVWALGTGFGSWDLWGFGGLYRVWGLGLRACLFGV